jgi:hypothetical protein
MRRAAPRLTWVVLAALTALLMVTADPARAASAPPLPVGNPVTVVGASALSAIACVSATHCEGVGSTSSAAAAVVAVTDGTPARALAVPSVPATDELTLSAIACPSATTCEAVGSLVDSQGDTSAVVVTITGGVPAAPQVVADAEAAAGDAPVLAGIACPSATSCEAVGEGEDAVATQISDGTPSPLSHDDDPQIAQLAGVVCATGSCDALGAGSDGAGIVVPVRGGSLGVSQTVNGTAMLATGGCAAGGGCEVLGTDSDGNSLLISDAAGDFGTPLRVRGDDLTSVSCLTTTLCAAAGSSATGEDVLVPISDGAPAAAVAAPFGPSGEVACGSAQICEVAGTTEAGHAAVTEIGPAVDAVSLDVGGARVRGTSALLALTCETACAGRVVETVRLPAGHATRRATVGTATFSLPAGGAKTVSVGLDATGRRALDAEHLLNVQLTVSSHADVSGAPSSVVAIRAATIRRRRAASGQ